MRKLYLSSELTYDEHIKFISDLSSDVGELTGMAVASSNIDDDFSLVFKNTIFYTDWDNVFQECLHQDFIRGDFFYLRVLNLLNKVFGYLEIFYWQDCLKADDFM